MLFLFFKQCSVSCGRGWKRRKVECTAKNNRCDYRSKPDIYTMCDMGKCPTWRIGRWSEVSETLTRICAIQWVFSKHCFFRVSWLWNFYLLLFSARWPVEVECKLVLWNVREEKESASRDPSLFPQSVVILVPVQSGKLEDGARYSWVFFQRNSRLISKSLIAFYISKLVPDLFSKTI